MAGESAEAMTSLRHASAILAGSLLLLALLAFPANAGCNNQGDTSDCLVSPTGPIGPVAIGDSSCSGSGGVDFRCDGGISIGAISITGNASCASGDGFGCGSLGIGAVSITGDAAATCSGPASCGGSLGIGAVSITGDAAATCSGPGSCGSNGIGALSVTGDASCHGACGTLGAPFHGLGAVSVLGHADCDQPFDAVGGHVLDAQCIGGGDLLLSASDCSALDPGAPGGGVVGTTTWAVLSNAHQTCVFAGAVQTALGGQLDAVSGAADAASAGASGLLGSVHTDALLPAATTLAGSLTSVALSQAHDTCFVVAGTLCDPDTPVDQTQRCPAGLAVPDPVPGSLTGDTLDNGNGAVQSVCAFALADLVDVGQATTAVGTVSGAVLGLGGSVTALLGALQADLCTYLTGNPSCA
jgi:hypothetical protein